MVTPGSAYGQSWGAGDPGKTGPANDPFAVSYSCNGGWQPRSMESIAQAAASKALRGGGASTRTEAPAMASAGRGHGQPRPSAPSQANQQGGEGRGGGSGGGGEGGQGADDGKGGDDHDKDKGDTSNEPPDDPEDPKPPKGGAAEDGGKKGGSGGGGGGGGGDETYDPDKGKPRSFRTPQDILNDPKTQPDKRMHKGNRFVRPGGLEEAYSDFQSLNPQDVKTIRTTYGPGKAGILPDGSSVSVRPASGSLRNPGPPTLQITPRGGGPRSTSQIIIRYR